jgi:hypothetical protein
MRSWETAVRMPMPVLVIALLYLMNAFSSYYQSSRPLFPNSQEIGGCRMGETGD